MLKFGEFMHRSPILFKNYCIPKFIETCIKLGYFFFSKVGDFLWQCKHEWTLDFQVQSAGDAHQASKRNKNIDGIEALELAKDVMQIK